MAGYFIGTFPTVGVFAGGETFPLQWGGDWVWLRRANFIPTIAFDGGMPISILPRQIMSLPFKQAIVSVPSGITAFTSLPQLEFVVGEGIPPLEIPAPLDAISHSNLQNTLPIPAGAATKLASFTIQTLEFDICIPTGEPNGLYYGSSAITAAKGLFIPVGVNFCVRDRQDPYLWNRGAGPVNASYQQRLLL